MRRSAPGTGWPLDPVPHRLPELLPHAWHGEEDRRATGVEVVLDRRQALREPGLATGQHLAEVADRALGDVGERQERQEAVVGPDGHDPGDVVDVGGMLPWVSTTPFGARWCRACRRGWRDRRGATWRRCGRRTRRVTRQLVVGRAPADRRGRRRRRGRDPRPVEHEDPVEQWELVRRRSTLESWSSVLDEKDTQPGVAEHVGDLARGVRGVDGTVTPPAARMPRSARCHS